MNTGTGVARKMSSLATRRARHAGSQLSLALDVDPSDEDALRAAWTRCGLRMPYHVALQNRPLSICLSCLADAMRRKSLMDSHGADGKRGSKPRSG